MNDEEWDLALRGGVAQLDPPPAPVVLLPNVEVDAEAEPELRIEPKFRARRIEVRRAARRQRRRIVALIVGLVVVVGASGGVLYSPLLAVDHIDVAGAHHLSESEVVRRSGIDRGDRLFDLDVDAVRSRVGRMGWVNSVRVERIWPDRVRIRVAERTPLVTVEAEGGARLIVTTGGYVVGKATGLDTNLPLVTVEGFTPRVGARLDDHQALAVEMLSVMPMRIAASMAAARVTADGEVVVELAPRGEIWFGRPEDIPRKLSNAAALLSGDVTLGCLQRIDVRIPSAAVLSRAC